jgi:hypothetical protein
MNRSLAEWLLLQSDIDWVAISPKTFDHLRAQPDPFQQTQHERKLNDLFGLLEQVRFDVNINDGSQNMLLLPAREGNLALLKILSARCANSFSDYDTSTACAITCKQNHAARISLFLDNWTVAITAEDEKGHLSLSRRV